LGGVPADADSNVGETGEGKVSEDYGKSPPPTEFILEMPTSAQSACTLSIINFLFPG